MKMNHHIIFLSYQLRIWIIAILFLGFISPAVAQTEEEAATEEMQSDSTVAEEETVVEKLTLRMSFEAFKINEQVKLSSRVRSKVDTKFQNTADVEVSFYKNEITPENLMGKDTSNSKGEAIYFLQVSENDPSMTYYAVVKDHPDFEDVEQTVTVNPSVLTMELMEEDSTRMVKIFVGSPNDSGIVAPVTETECKLYVKRLFGYMPLGDPETTDEDGYVTFEFPSDIKGDTAGNLTLVARVIEHEMIGNVETSQDIRWGIPTEISDFYSQRQLWSARANSPIILIVVVNLAILGIWGVIAFIFFEIYKINKLGKAN